MCIRDSPAAAARRAHVAFGRGRGGRDAPAERTFVRPGQAGTCLLYTSQARRAILEDRYASFLAHMEILYPDEAAQGRGL